MEMKLATRLDNLAFIVSATSLQTSKIQIGFENPKQEVQNKGMYETFKRNV